MILMENRVPRYRIVLPEGADESLRWAGQQLADYLEKMGGGRLPVVSDKEPAEAREIVIGPADRPGRPDTAALRNDGYILLTVGQRLFLAGENRRGCLYAVYGLLERHLGCRFFSQYVEKVPVRDTVTLPPLEETVIPPLEYRETFWYPVEYCADLAVKRGFNSSYYGVWEPRHGGDVHYCGFDHTLFSYVSPEEYFDTHPEYFSMVNGERIREQTQLCLSNPEVLAITIEKLRQRMREHPESKYFSLSQMDWYNPCECPECARIDAEEGSHAGTLLRFVNACADAVAEEFPDRVVDTFAYTYTRQPPKLTRPRPNVCIRICSIECCFAHPIETCDFVRWSYRDKLSRGNSFREDLLGWARICSRIFVWDYTTNYHHFPAPFWNFRVLRENIKFFLKNGVTGLFEQGNYQAESAEFGELRAYLISKLMWDPDTDLEKDMLEFLAGYYGMAAAPIRRYLELLGQLSDRPDCHLGIFDDPSQTLDDDFLARADALWEEAERLAEDEAVLTRVQRSRMQVTYVKILRLPVGSPERIALAEAFGADVRRFGITRIREFFPVEKGLAFLRDGTPYGKRQL